MHVQLDMEGRYVLWLLWYGYISKIKRTQKEFGVINMYLIMPPVTVPPLGSCQVLYKSWISSCRWGWAHTKPAYFVTSGQSWEATTCTKVVGMSLKTKPTKKRFWRNTNFDILTAAIDGLQSSPDSGWVTSAPNIIVGMSLTKGILQRKASSSTVFLPPIYKEIRRPMNSILERNSSSSKKKNIREKALFELHFS